MRTKFYIISMLLGASALCCNVEPSGEGEDGTVNETIDSADGYGPEKIGFRTGSGSESEGERDHGAGGAPAEDADGGYGGEGEGEGESEGEGEGENDTDTGGDPVEQLIDAAFLENEVFEDPWYGMIYEGEIDDPSASINPLIAQSRTAGALGGADLSSNPAQTSLVDDVDALLGVTQITATSSELLRDDYVVTSIFDKDELWAAAQSPATFAHGFATLVIKNSYQKDTNGYDVLRQSCIVASHEPAQDNGGLPGEAVCHSQNGTSAFEPYDPVSLAYKAPLSVDPAVVSQEYVDNFKETLPEYDGAPDMCLCFDEQGQLTQNCADLGRPGLYPPPQNDEVKENPFYTSSLMPTTTFSLDVDTGGYTLVRQKLENGELPAPESVRIEEMINYFKYFYTKPEGDDPFTIYTEMADCPWNENRKIVMLGLRGQEIEMTDQPAANLVYLIDSSGSMMQELPLIQAAFRMLTRQMRPDDRLSIVTYAGSDTVVLDGGSGEDKEKIYTAIDQFRSGGSTNGAGGIQKAYELAEKHFIEGGNNRVILATDGDFNVGISSEAGLVELIEQKADSGVFLTVYGFNVYGHGNYQDSKMEQLANNGNGTYFFIDSGKEAERAFMHSLSGTLLTIAKDVKLQVQFNPDAVRGYRLIGYDNRILSNEDFNDDTVDAGELGNSEDMTAFFEIIPVDSGEKVPETDVTNDPNADDETVYEPLDADSLLAVRLRYKNPDSDESELISRPVTQRHERDEPSLKLTFASAVAQAGLVLRQSQYIEERRIAPIIERLRAAFEGEENEALTELLSFLEKAQELAGR